MKTAPVRGPFAEPVTGSAAIPPIWRPRSSLLLAAAIALATFLVYSPTLAHPFIRYDDQDYVFENPHVRAGLTWGSIRWSFTAFDCANWHPLTWLSLELDAQLWGVERAGGFHGTNVLLHTANTFLLSLVLIRLTGSVGRSLLVAALFGLHPLHVESVAWVAERKDVLSTLFGLLTLAAYGAYSHRPGTWNYVLVLAAFGLGLLAKPMLVTLPFVLLLLDYWPLRRLPPGRETGGWSRLLIEKLPLFLLALASCIVTFVAQRRGGSVGSVAEYPLGLRIENALGSYVIYLRKTLWPSDLAAFYPHPGIEITPASALIAGGSLVALTVLSLSLWRRQPYVPVGWLWYLGTLIPAIGLVQVGEQGMADRYTYFPLIGLFLLAVWGISDLVIANRALRLLAGALAAFVFAGLVVQSLIQVRYWRDDVALWRHALQVTPKNWYAHLNLAEILVAQGRPREAIPEYQGCLAIRPDLVATRNNLAAELHKLGRADEALAEYRQVLERDPQSAPALHNLAALLSERGEDTEAIAAFQQELALDATSAQTHYDLGVLFLELRRLDEAAEMLRQALKLDPRGPLVFGALGQVLVEQGNYAEAAPLLQQALGMVGGNGLLQVRLQHQLELCRRLEACEKKLPELTDGKATPADVQEQLDAAWLCQLHRKALYATAVRLYASAFAAQPALVKDARQGLRYHAACAAARASAGQGRDASSLTVIEKVHLREQALTWLRENLISWILRIDSSAGADRLAATRTLRRTQQDPALACVRSATGLEKLPEREQTSWSAYWASVDRALKFLNEKTSGADDTRFN
jgi:tetratricopeptide (TPR) repeat protein